MSDETEKIDLEQLVGGYKVENEEAFKAYLKELWIDLTQRNQDKSNTGISKITFSNYYNLPGIILDRLFSVLDTNKSGFLETQEFINGMCILFCGDFDSQTNFIFKFYDFDKTGQISKEDIRTVLSYISLSQEIKNYKDRVISQKELMDIIEKCFSKIQGDKMNYNQFKKCIEEINSDIYLMILLFLYEKKPFNKAVLNTYLKIKINNSPSPYRSPAVHSPKKMVVSPSKNTSFSPYNIFSRERKRGATVKEVIGIGIDGNVKATRSRRHSTIQSNVINLIDIGMTKKSKFNNENDNANEAKSPKRSPKKDKNDPEYYSPILRKRKRNLKDLKNKDKENFVKLTGKPSKKNIEENIQLMPAYKQEKKGKDDDKSSETGSITSGEILDKKKNDELLDFGSDEDNSDEEDQENVVTNDGYLVKIVDNKMKKIFFKLVGRDLFYFKSDKDELHKGMHNLSGVFINEEIPKVVNGKKFFCFSVTYPKKTRYYYIEKEDEYKTWVEKLKLATGYTNLLDLYEVKEKLGNGKFGLIKLGINKKTGQKVAIKIMSKKDMTNQDLELVRTEIEILKICQHPNIIELYEVFENASYFYIIMEYCSGGDLFSYLEQRNFRLPEEQACKFMHKMCAAIYYCHSYGIAHRDLKPENVLMTSNKEDADLRILDFGLSKIIGPDEKCTEPYGTLSYVAPEVLLDEPYGKEVDLWSLGVITYLMLSGSLPFDDKHDEEEIARKTVAEPPPYKGSIWKKISPEARDFIKRLLEKDPKKRMNIKEALQHEWFHKYGGEQDLINERRSSKHNDGKKTEFELYSRADKNI